MSERELEQLQLSSEQVHSAVDFHEAYGRFCLVELEEQASDPEDLRNANETWTAFADAASALRQAGQWAMLIDPPRALRLLSEAGLVFDRLGYGFGTYLIAACRPRLLLASAADAAAGRLLEVLEGAPLPLDSPMHHAQQQAYLLLACAGLRHAGGPSELSSTLERTADRSPHRNGVLPVGALGTPIGRYWRFALDLMRLREPNAREMRDAEGSLAFMCGEYARSIESAMVNTRLWSNAAAPVDVADVDVACMMSLMARAWGPARVVASLEELAGGLNPTAAIPVRIGLDLLTRESDEYA